MRSILKKKGVMGLNTAKAFVIAVLGLSIITMATLITLDALDGTSIATDATKNVSANISSGISEFWSNAPTFFTLLAVVVIILIIAAVVVVVNRFGGGAPSAGL